MPIANQLALFCICVLTGFIYGPVYEAFSLLRDGFAFLKRGKRIVTFALDILFFISFAVWCVGVFYLFEFPDFRFYFLLGFLIGAIIYLKSLHRILAFFKKICYNKLVKVVKKRKNRKKQDKLTV